MRNVSLLVQQLILGGHVLAVEKTKTRNLGGKQTVTVGPYRTANNDRMQRFAFFTKEQSSTYPAAISAAQDFVDFVGRDLAWEAATRCKREIEYFRPARA